MKKLISSFVLCFLLVAAHAQILFTYGKKSVASKEFLRAFNKNNSVSPSANRSKAMQEYLNLFINSKLKVQEAYARGYDTIPAIAMEVENLRLQIIDNFMNDPQAVDKLAKEAFDRSQKDIHIAHIFIALKNEKGEDDMTAANGKKDAVMKRLNAGEDFMKVAAELSDDPSAKANKGDLGFITVFSLPYVLENIAYTTPVGKFSAPYLSKSGYHIIKNIEERKAVGKIKAQQILLALPPDAAENDKKENKRRADSLYQRIVAGDDFSKLAARFSNDYVTASSEGNMPEFGVGQYETKFEKTVFALKKDGDVSPPFETEHGYHIVKRISHKPVVTDVNNKEVFNELRKAVNNAERMAASQKAMAQRIQKQVGSKMFPYQKEVLYDFTDSVLNNTKLGVGAKQDANAPLIKIGDSTYRVPDWVGYAQVFRFTTNGGIKKYDELMEEFIQANVMQYYRQHLELYNEDFRNQMTEFKDGNLFFEIMQREIWNNAQTDSAGLRNYYEKNKLKYRWNNSADAVVFYCSDENTARDLYGKLKNNPADWRNIVSTFEERVSSDSNRMELDAIPVKNKSSLAAGLLTQPAISETDKTASLAYVINLYPGVAQRSFDEARGLVLNDYQNMLDENWVAQLKKKYPVTVNQAVFQSLK